MADAFEDPAQQLVLDAQKYRLACSSAVFINPRATFFHLFFRSSAIVTYILCEIFSANFVLNFIIVVLLLSFDFWTVKNISGRLLVGLRWWNHINEDGESAWVFESKQRFTPHPTEARLFWWSLYLFTAAWVLLAVVAALKLNFTYLIMVIVALALNLSNVIGYTKCDKDAKQKLTGLAADYSKSFLTSMLGAAFAPVASAGTA